MPHFWRVEPTRGEPPTIVCFELAGGEYVKQAIVTEGGPASVRVGEITDELDATAVYRDWFPAG